MLCYSAYNPLEFLKNGVAMTVRTASWGKGYWQQTTLLSEPLYHTKVLFGGQGVPIFS